MRRREFITLLGGAAAWPLAVRAQQGDRMWRIGVLIPGDESDPEWKPFLSTFTNIPPYRYPAARANACVSLRAAISA